MKMTKNSLSKFLIASALSAIASLATAAGFTANGSAGLNVDTYTANGSGYANSATVGGGQAATTNNHTGLSTQFTANEGSNHATAGVNLGTKDVTTYTGGASTQTSVSAGYTTGGATGSTAGGVANDYTAKSFGSFTANKFGGAIQAYTKLEAYTAQ